MNEVYRVRATLTIVLLSYEYG